MKSKSRTPHPTRDSETTGEIIRFPQRHRTAQSRPAPKALYLRVSHPADTRDHTFRVWNEKDHTLEAFTVTQEVASTIIDAQRLGIKRFFIQMKRYEASPEVVISSGEIEQMYPEGDGFVVHFTHRRAHHAPPQWKKPTERPYIAGEITSDDGDFDEAA